MFIGTIPADPNIWVTTAYNVYRHQSDIHVHTCMYTHYSILMHAPLQCVGNGCKYGPFFMFRDWSQLSQPVFVVNVCEALSTIGQDPWDYVSHGFKIGAATTAALEGLVTASWLLTSTGKYSNPAKEPLIGHVHVGTGELELSQCMLDYCVPLVLFSTLFSMMSWTLLEEV